MSGIINNESMRIVRSALDGLAMRQQVTSHNLANAETPGFSASAVSFEQALQRAMRPTSGFHLVSTHSNHFALDGRTNTDMSPQVFEISEKSARNDENSVDLDREMTVLADTAIHYQALTRMLSRRFALLRTVVTEGR